MLSKIEIQKAYKATHTVIVQKILADVLSGTYVTLNEYDQSAEFLNHFAEEVGSDRERLWVRLHVGVCSAKDPTQTLRAIVALIENL